MSEINPCEYFQRIEANPKAITPQVTVRQWLKLKEHLYGCDVCNNRVERVLARAPKEQFPQRGEN